MFIDLWWTKFVSWACSTMQTFDSERHIFRLMSTGNCKFALWQTQQQKFSTQYQGRTYILQPCFIMIRQFKLIIISYRLKTNFMYIFLATVTLILTWMIQSQISGFHPRKLIFIPSFKNFHQDLSTVTETASIFSSSNLGLGPSEPKHSLQRGFQASIIYQCIYIFFYKLQTKTKNYLPLFFYLLCCFYCNKYQHDFYTL